MVGDEFVCVCVRVCTFGILNHVTLLYDLFLRREAVGAVGSIRRGPPAPHRSHLSAWASGAAAAHGTLYQLPGG